MAALGEDHCEVTQGQSPRHPAPGASSSPGPGEPRSSTSRASRRARPGSPHLPDHAGLPSTQPRGLSLGPWVAAARSVSAGALHTRVCVCTPTCSARRLHDGPAGRISQKKQNPHGGAGARGAEPACRHHSTSCSMRPGLRAPSPTGRSRGRGPHLSADLDTTLFIPKPLTLSQHGPPGATHQGCSPDSWRNTGPGARGPPGASGRCSLPTPGPRSSLRKDHCC